MGLFSTSGSPKVFYVMCTVSQWVDVFTRPVYMDIVLELLDEMRRNDGLSIYSWVIMSNRVQFVCAAKNEHDVDSLINSFKKQTSDRIITAIEHNEGEQRKAWLFWLLKQIGGNISLWQSNYEKEELISRDAFYHKTDLMHLGPVKAGLVDKPSDYRYSSARDFDGAKGLLTLSVYDIK